ncbi:hypothetical protein [Cyanothece sp. BG0011]|uniref:hypothetical protein n=1 Tax=Cyanothece sp. BG0011 TaxID=2082950 RepID=UPI000D1DAF75|nr:hypothetical protein [Cyanothece sp. BG0011]
MNAVPERFPTSEIKNFQNYVCPISGIKANGKNAPSQWVNCPLVEQPICYGLCLDLQSIARDDEFDDHLYVEDFYKLAKKLNVDVLKLRKTCLNHQKKILIEMLNDEFYPYPEDKEESNVLLDWIVKLSNEL